jgi:hypothetical protein
MSASWESSRSSCCSGCWSAVASSLAPTLSGPAGQPASILHLSLYLKQKNAGKSRINESTLFNRIHKDWGQIHWLVASRLLFYPFPGFSVHSFLQKSNNYFHKELILFEKSAEIHPFSRIPHCTHGMSGFFEYTRKKGRLGIVTTGIFHLIIFNTGSGLWVIMVARVKCHDYWAGIFKVSRGARNRGGRGLSYRPARLHRLAEFIPWNRFRGPIHVQKYGLR